MKQIIAIGGGGFGRNPSDKKIEEYIIKQQNNKNPNVCFIKGLHMHQNFNLETF